MFKVIPGKNRRSQERRQLKDRRLAIRFDLVREPRRQIDDRRSGAAWARTFSDR